MNQMLIEHLRHCPRPFVTDIELKTWLPGSADSRYGKVKRLIDQQQLLHLRRGLYALTDTLGYPRKPHPYELALFIYGPSYISLESALSYHGFIPEAVYTTTSACTHRSKTFETPLGLFSFQRLPRLNFYTGVTLIKDNGYQYMMATPWKAICDYIYCYKKNWTSLEPFAESLRMDTDQLPLLTSEMIPLLDEYYHQKRISRFLKNIKEY